MGKIQVRPAGRRTALIFNNIAAAAAAAAIIIIIIVVVVVVINVVIVIGGGGDGGGGDGVTVALFCFFQSSINFPSHTCCHRVQHVSQKGHGQHFKVVSSVPMPWLLQLGVFCKQAKHRWRHQAA